MNKAYLLIGGNMGDREAFLDAARQLIAQDCGPILQSSAIYQTAAWGLENQESFLNQVLLIQTSFDAYQLLETILKIEAKIGRKREVKYGPRTIDIDILLFNADVINREELIIPHPQMQYRRFALQPLEEIASGIMHPVLNKTIATLLTECPDELAVKKFLA